MYMTRNMRATLEQICTGNQYVDVRSAAALTRRGLALPCRDHRGIKYRLYEPTEKGKALLAEQKANKNEQTLDALRFQLNKADIETEGQIVLLTMPSSVGSKHLAGFLGNLRDKVL